jgi:hypothetical protein
MSTEIVPSNVRAQIELSKQMADSSMLPKAYQKQPANLLWAIQYAESLGVHPMTAVTGIHVIDGKPTASAQLIGGLVRRAGHKLRVTFDRQTMTATAEIVRADDPDFVFKSVWTMDRAKEAGLAGKNVWKQYPDAMLKARAITEVARDAAPESLYGVIYTAEELGAEVSVAGDGEIVVAVADTIEPIITEEQRKEILTLAEALDLKQEKLEAGIRAVTGVGSMEFLTKSDADRVIERMNETLARAMDTATVEDAEIVEEVPVAA